MSEKYRSRIERRKGKKKHKVQKKRGIFKKIAITLALLFVMILIAGGITVFAILKDAPALDPELLKDPESSTIYDMNDHEVATMSGVENREIASISEIPEHVQNAFIAIEDVRFREHFGVDIWRIGGAIIANIKEGFGAEGASTITQQVIKRSFLTPEKSLKRKIQEAYLAVKLEQRYSKEQILEMYLNKIYFGNNAYGVKTAAETYFQKELDELTVSEGALLAGLPQLPNYYDPFKNPEAAEKRRNTVISLMVEYGFINESQAEEAKSIAVTDMLQEPKEEQQKYQAFIDQVFSEVEQIEGLSARDIYESGLKIYTTLDTKAQNYTDSIMDDNRYFPDEKIQAGLVLLDTQSGAIRAIGGGRNKGDGKLTFNYGTESKRQPGSAIKPILDYGPAIEYLKWSTGKLIKDEKLVINGKEIRNYDRRHRGNVTMRTALQHSINVPAVKTFLQVGEENAKEFAANLGIELEEMYPSYAIGGFETGISPLQLAGAYAAFGNEGIYNKPHTVRKIVFPNGREIDNQPEPTAAMSDYTAYMVTDMLKTVVRSGTGRSVHIPSLPIAGKTGTTNETKDAWFTGYTTNYTAAVWTGYKERNSIQGGSKWARNIFKDLIAYVSEGVETADFNKPDSVVEVALEKGTEKKPSKFTPESDIIYELFVRGTEPTTVSDAYDKPASPTGLEASFNEEANEITLSWDYAEEDGYEFIVKTAVDDGEFATETTTEDRIMTISDIQAGSEYRFQVIAVEQESENQSDPARVGIQIPDQEEEEDIPAPLEEDEQEDEQNEDGEENDEEPDRDENDEGERDNQDEENDHHYDGDGNGEEDQQRIPEIRLD